MIARSKQRANRAKIDTHRDTRATSLTSRCSFCFQRSKSLVERSFVGNYNSSPPPVHGSYAFGVRRLASGCNYLSWRPLLFEVPITRNNAGNAGNAEIAGNAGNDQSPITNHPSTR
jgi:hypothetical protein